MKAPEKLNGNNLALWLTSREAGKQEVSIAQIKEILKHLSILASTRPLEVINLLVRLGERHKK